MFNKDYPYVIVWRSPLSVHNMVNNNIFTLIFIITISTLSGILFFLATGNVNTQQYAIEAGLRKHEFNPVYQPIISSTTGTVVGLEVLTRWTRMGGDAVPPDLFISCAEQNNLLEKMTMYILTCVEADLPYFHNGNIYLAINISPGMLESCTFTRRLIIFSDLCKKNGIRLLAELTERESLEESI
jgi:FOG: EAL domain